MVARGGAGTKVNAKLEKAIQAMLDAVIKDKNATLTDKCKVIDRALKLEAIKMKADDAGYGSAFGEDEPESEDGE